MVDNELEKGFEGNGCRVAEVPTRYFSRGTGKNHEKLESAWPVSTENGTGNDSNTTVSIVCAVVSVVHFSSDLVHYTDIRELIVSFFNST
jgi:hypothetical protein